MPTTVFSDNCNRPDNTSLGANWSEDSGDWQILSNQLRGPSGTAPFVVSTTTTAHAALQDVAAQVKRRVPGSDDGGPCVRRVAATSFYYADSYPTKLDLIKRVAGTDTTIQSNSFTQADNDVVRIEATGASPTTLKMFVGGVQKGTTTTDSQASLQASGQAGLLAWTAAHDFDDFQVDDLGAVVVDTTFGVRVPNYRVGPVALRFGMRSTLPADMTQAPATDTNFGTRVRVPNNRVGPMALRQLYRPPAYPFDSTIAVATGNRRRRVICAGA